MHEFDIKDFKVGDSVLVEEHASGRTHAWLTVDMIESITPKKQDIKLKSGKVFSNNGQEKERRSFATRWNYLLKYDKEVWETFYFRAMASQLAEKVDFFKMSKDEAKEVYAILKAYKPETEEKK